VEVISTCCKATTCRQFVTNSSAVIFAWTAGLCRGEGGVRLGVWLTCCKATTCRQFVTNSSAVIFGWTGGLCRGGAGEGTIGRSGYLL
jgi:hypothetical protein